MLRHQLLMAWNMFVDTVQETQHNRETVRKVLLRMQSCQLAGAFERYAGAVDTLVAQRQKVAKTMARWKAPGLKKAWERWEAYLEEEEVFCSRGCAYRGREDMEARLHDAGGHARRA